MKFLFLLPLFLSPFSAFAESHPEYSGIENPSEYNLVVDENIYPIQYQVNSDVIAMEIDPELTSLLIGLENSKDSLFLIDLDHNVIRAENNDFVVLVNGYDTDYEIVSDSDSSTLTFYIPEFTEEIEIIGTHVIPEFPIGAIMGFALLVSFVAVFYKIKPSFRL